MSDLTNDPQLKRVPESDPFSKLELRKEPVQAQPSAEQVKTIDLDSCGLSVTSPSLKDEIETQRGGLMMEKPRELEMVEAQEYDLNIKQEQQVEGPKVPHRQFRFRGHRGGSSYLDRLVTLIADFIKKLEVKLFKMLERRRVERITRKIIAHHRARGVVIAEEPGRGVSPNKSKKKKERQSWNFLFIK